MGWEAAASYGSEALAVDDTALPRRSTGRLGSFSSGEDDGAAEEPGELLAVAWGGEGGGADDSSDGFFNVGRSEGSLGSGDVLDAEELPLCDEEDDPSEVL